MGANTQIEWTDATWNPWIGCERVSPACAHCYMFREQRAYGNDPEVVRRTKAPTFYAPLYWKEPRRVFTCSWSDFFIEQADPWRVDAYTVILGTPHLTYQILTKRPERIPEIEWPILGMARNVWTGVSVENRRFYWRIDALRKIRPNLLFLSIEPLLGRMPDLPLEGVGWVIVGGESGPKFRPLNLDWVREIRDRCQTAGVPFFFKQHSGFRPKQLGRLLDGREWNEFPAV
jgi:protein gp37